MTTNELISLLAAELACSLEMNFDRHEIKDLWPEALTGLSHAADHFRREGVPTPGVVESVLAHRPRP